MKDNEPSEGRVECDGKWINEGESRVSRSDGTGTLWHSGSKGTS
jgi:hypothetical protein